MIIGSTAIKHHFPDFNREPKDVDITYHNGIKIVYSEIGKKTEYLENPILDVSLRFATPNELYTLKMSHLIGWDINWEKHMFDLQFLKSRGCVLDKELFNNLYDYWNTVHVKNRRSNLDMSAKEFFDNALQTPHDYYHTLLNPSPTYLKVLKDGCEVDVCENKFNKLSFEERCALVHEEVVIMAVERWPEMDYRFAYSKMLKKFILNHSPIWEGIFIIENYKYLSKCPVQLFKTLNKKLNELSIAKQVS